MQEQSVQGGQKLRDLVFPCAQFPGSGTGSLHLGRCPTSSGDQGSAKCDLQVEFLMVPIRATREAGQ